MIEVRRGADGEVCVVGVPNRSLSWRQFKLLMPVLAAPPVIVAAWFAWHGLWLIAPFAGGELLLLTGAMYLTLLRQQRQEVIRVGAGAVVVERGKRGPEERIRVPRAWARLEVAAPRRPWSPPLLTLCAPGYRVAVGEWLNAADREALVHALARAGVPPARVGNRPSA